jgi:acetyltransferase-like isoleucine patch superfamily enzyme
MMFSRDELLSMGFAYVGQNVKVFKNSTLVKCENIYLGDACQIDDFVHIIASEPLRIGRRVHIACYSSIAGGGEVSIEDYCGLSAGCRLISGSEDFMGGGMTNPCIPEKFRKVTRSHILIKKHSILGTNTIVYPGVTINEGVATGSATIVNKDLESWGLYMGAPAKRIKERPREMILSLEQELIKEFGY